MYLHTRLSHGLGTLSEDVCLHGAGFLQEVTAREVPVVGKGGGASPEAPRVPVPIHTVCPAHSSMETGRNTLPHPCSCLGRLLFFSTPQMKHEFIPLKGKRQILARLSDYLFTGQ